MDANHGQSEWKICKDSRGSTTAVNDISNSNVRQQWKVTSLQQTHLSRGRRWLVHACRRQQRYPIPTSRLEEASYWSAQNCQTRCRDDYLPTFLWSSALEPWLSSMTSNCDCEFRRGCNFILHANECVFARFCKEIPKTVFLVLSQSLPDDDGWSFRTGELTCGASPPTPRTPRREVMCTPLSVN